VPALLAHCRLSFTGPEDSAHRLGPSRADVHGGDLADALPHVLYHLESADVDLVRSALPTHFATTLARRHVKVLTGEGADELFAGYSYHHAYAGKARALADELTRSLGTMHNINLQRVDGITMAQGLEARTPFLDRELIAFAQSIPASLKLKVDPGTRATTEKWVLRKACEDLLPAEVIWRKKPSSTRAAAPSRRSIGHSRACSGRQSIASARLRSTSACCTLSTGAPT
jgi:asparagine synthase (glutamine-hydrolysing)